MADEIEIGSKAIKQIQQLRDELLSADQALIKLSQNAIQAGKNIGGISTPGGLTKSGNDNAKISAELETLKSKYVSLSDTIIKKAEQSRLAEIRLQQAREKAFDDYARKSAKQEADELAKSNKIIVQKEKEFAIFEKQFNKYEADLAKKAIAEEKASQKAIISANKQAEAEAKQNLVRRQAFDTFEKNSNKEAALNAKNETSYQRIQNSVALLTKTYQDLAIRKQLGSNLTATEEKQLMSLTSRINTYQAALLKTDSQIGKNQRNVGNYASSYNGLGNSINQITRELPAFTFSAQTGFLALSNNIPILTDEIGRLQTANKELISQGKPVKSVFSQIVGSVLSLQTAMGVAILLFTLYGKEIGNFFKGTTKAKEAQKALNEEVEKSKYAVEKETVQLKVLTQIVNDNTKSSKDRKLAYDEIKEVLPGLTSQTYENAIATGELSRVTDLYTASLIARNVVEIKSKGIAERQSELDFKMSKSTKERLTFWEKVRVEYTAQGLTYSDFTRRLKAQDQAEQDLINTDIKSLSVDLLKSNALESQIEKYTVNTKGIKDNSKETKEHVQLTTNSEKAIQANITAMKEQLSNIDKTSDAYALLNALIELTEASTNLLGKSSQEIFIKPIIEDTSGEIIPPVSQNQEDQSEWLKQYAKDQEDFLEKQKEIQSYLKSFSSEFMSNSGFSETFSLLNGEIEGFGENFAVTFNAIAESAQEAFNFISNISQQNFDNENARLQSQYETALKYAGGSSIAEAKLAEDLEKKKKEISIREAKAKQKQAIFNIAIDTAQAIMATVGKTGFAGLPLALTLGALGAAQIALVASQKIPQYWMGGTHDGGLMMVNDGAGSNFRETIVTPDGNIHKPQGKNVIMNAPAGTEIFTHDQWNDQMNNMLKGNGINWNNAQYQQSNITKEDMKSAMMEAIGSQTQYHSNFDANGATNYILKNGNKTKSSSNRGNSIKQRFT